MQKLVFVEDIYQCVQGARERLTRVVGGKAHFEGTVDCFLAQLEG